jgi:hypothetical protein
MQRRESVETPGPGDVADELKRRLQRIEADAEILGLGSDVSVDPEAAESQTALVGLTDGALLLDQSTTAPVHTGATLLSQAEALVNEVSESRGALYDMTMPLPAGDQVGLLIELLESAASDDRETDMEVFGDDAPGDLHIGSFVPLLRRAAAANARIRFIVISGRQPRNDQASDALVNLQRMCAEVGSPRVTVSTTTEGLPPMLIVNGRVIVIGGDSWFRRRLDSNCAFVVESPALAAEIRLLALDPTLS